MLAINRRVVLATAGIVAASLADDEAASCSIVATVRPRAFSDAACRRSLRQLVDLIHRAPSLPAAQVDREVGALSITFDPAVVAPIMNYPNGPTEDADLVAGWSLSEGRRDRTPIAIAEMTLLKEGRGIALYQFTLRRDRFFAEVTGEDAAGDSCGMAMPAHYGRREVSYLGVFRNNALRQISAFDAWLERL